MLTIYQPEIMRGAEKSRLVAAIDIDGKKSEIWFEVGNDYEKYLCHERSDAFVVGALQWAMRAQHDITIVAPITEELLYNLHEHLIPILVKHSKTFRNTRIIGPTAPDPIEKLDVDGVGTGMSCGVDSFHAVLNHYKNTNEKPNLTHLCINSTGSFQETAVSQIEGGPAKAKAEVFDRARAVAKELGLPLIETDSNIYDVFRIFEFAHTFNTTFATMCMQKLWKTYFFASSKDYSFFSLKNHESKDCSFYDLLSLSCFTTRGLRFYSEGSSIDRLEKIAFMVDNPVAQKYLHCCFVKTTNCAICYKCRRTMIMLDTLNKLDDFSDCFPIDYYRANMADYYAWYQKTYEDKNAHAMAIAPNLANAKYMGEFLRKRKEKKSAGITKAEGEFPDVGATSICIMNVENKGQIYIENANSIAPTAASKILTCILGIEKGELDKAYGYARAQGEALTLRDLLYGMMLESNNDFADAIALSISGSVQAFVSSMNSFAKNMLHMNNSNFQLPSGLKGYSTTRDTALLMCYALQNPVFCEIISAPEYTWTSSNGAHSYVFRNTNALIHNDMYPHCTGGKTAVLNGNHHLISVARKDDQWHVVSQSGASSHNICFDDAIAMHEWAFDFMKKAVPPSEAEQKLKNKILDASLSFTTRKMNQRGQEKVFTTNPEVAYCSFSTPNFTIRREEAQRDSEKRFARFGITKDSLKDKTVLDLGCFIGAILFHASNMGIKSGLGVEYDADKVEIAKEIAEMSNLDMLTFRQGDIDELEAEDLGQFDVVFSLAVEGHLRDRERYFSLMHKLTKEVLYLECNITARAADVTEMLKQAGFSEIEYIGYSDDDINLQYNRRPMFKAIP
ncbi:MAG: methyltransferase domain-containing protein [Defluviitaleaceae bacterium]|nr:methyltransferase domain-containing protein [Defluviitaleaceae bacterium]